jgi:hypothetical protein
MREANEQMQSLLGGYGSLTARARCEAREGAYPSAVREAALGIDKFVAEAMGNGQGSASFRAALGTDCASRAIQKALGMDRGSVAMPAALSLDRTSLAMREALGRTGPRF